MRVGMLLDVVYPPDIRVEKEVRTLLDAGHEVFVLSPAAEGRSERETIDGAEVIRRPMQRTYDGIRGWGPGLKYLVTHVHRGWLRAADEIIRSEELDVLHPHDLPVVKPALKLGDEHGIPVVADLHENWPEAKRYYRKGWWRNALTNPRPLLARLLKSRWRLKRLEHNCVQRADRVITVVEEAKEHYVRDCGAAPETVHVISNVVDLEAFDEVTTRSLGYEDAFVVSYVGTMSGEHRGLHTVVEAMPGIVDAVEDVRLLIVGPESPYRRRLQELSSDLGVDDWVTFTGRVPFDEVPSYIAASDVGLVPHQRTPHTETTIPHKLFQYMAMETPVIVTDAAPLARIVGETDAGRIVPADDPSAMTEATVALARHPEVRAELGQYGRRAVEERYNWENEGKKLRDLYRSL